MAQVVHRRYTKRDDRGKRTECLLSVVYRNMKGRASGHSTKSPWCYVRGFPWASYDEFRAWALTVNATGTRFTKATPSPDRVNTREPYGPNNVKWVAKYVNCSTASGRAWFLRNHDDVRGREPPLPPLVDDAEHVCTEVRLPRRQRTGRALDVVSDVPF